MLAVGFADATVQARAFTAPLADPLTRDGWRGAETVRDAATTIATLDFGTPTGLYDFTDNQWWNPLRARRIVVRGTLGELVDDRVVRMVDPRTPVESHLQPSAARNCSIVRARTCRRGAGMSASDPKL